MKTYSIQLTAEQWNIVGDALGDKPFKNVAKIIAEMSKQVSDQDAVKTEESEG
jgi:hypothetical protein